MTKEVLNNLMLCDVWMIFYFSFWCVIVHVRLHNVVSILLTKS